MNDILIRNVRIVDGTGAPARTGDVVIRGRTITHVTEPGAAPTDARRIFEGEGLMLTPGFVDIHTHYDGQVCWDKEVTPSCWHGITTIVMGNCGVGFAPVRPGTEDELVSLMESVEDIPGTALHEGIPWTWETFPEYLDAIDTPYVMDIGAQVPHVAVRHYVMGDRCYDDATPSDMAEMRDLTREALEAGALGFSTSRFYGHMDKQGNVVPGTHANAEEMVTIGDAFAGLDHGTIEIISDHLEDDDELAWMEHILRATGRPITTLTAVGNQKVFPMAERLRAEGLEFRPQAGARPASILMSLDGTINPMRQHTAYREIADAPLSVRMAAMRDPAFRARVLTEEPILPRNPDAVRFMNQFEAIYVMDDALSYEPAHADSVAGIAAEKGLEPVEVIMDAFAENRMLLVFFRGYRDNLEGQRALIENPVSVFGLSDGGAHCGVLVDASLPTYMLSYFARDRQRGPRIALEEVVRKMTSDTAALYGMHDRGIIAPGYKADLNLIDFDALRLHAPEMAWDLPSGGKRLLQKADGYVATICAGEVTYENGEHTGALPGRLVRGAQRTGESA